MECTVKIVLQGETMNAKMWVLVVLLFGICMTGCGGGNNESNNPYSPTPTGTVEEYLDASVVELSTSLVGSNTWNYTVKVWGGVNQTITSEALVAESNPEQVSIYVKRITDNSAEQIILLAKEMISSGTFHASDKASVKVVKKA